MARELTSDYWEGALYNSACSVGQLPFEVTSCLFASANCLTHPTLLRQQEISLTSIHYSEITY